MTERLHRLAQGSDTALTLELRDVLQRSQTCTSGFAGSHGRIWLVYERRARWNDDPRNDLSGNIEGYPALIQNLRTFPSDFPGEQLYLYEADPDGRLALVFVNESHTSVIGILRWKTNPPKWDINE